MKPRDKIFPFERMDIYPILDMNMKTKYNERAERDREKRYTSGEWIISIGYETAEAQQQNKSRKIQRPEVVSPSLG